MQVQLHLPSETETVHLKQPFTTIFVAFSQAWFSVSCHSAALGLGVENICWQVKQGYCEFLFELQVHLTINIDYQLWSSSYISIYFFSFLYQIYQGENTLIK